MGTNRSVIVIRDPSGIFEPGAGFTVMDLAAGVLHESWSIGMEFQLNGYTAKMIGKVLVRSDGKKMHVNSGGSYKWKELK